MRTFVSWCVGLFRAIPLVGELATTDVKHTTAAMKELAWTTALATLPIWFFPLLALLLFPGAPSYDVAIWNSIAQGDLYLYSASIVGVLMFALTTNYAEWNSESRSAPRIGRLTFLFPYGTAFIVICLVIAVVSTFVFGVIRYQEIGQIKARLNVDLLVNASVWIYGAANICMFLVSVYRNGLKNISIAAGSDEREFVRRYLEGQSDGQ